MVERGVPDALKEGATRWVGCGDRSVLILPIVLVLSNTPKRVEDAALHLDLNLHHSAFG
jgi:hypothetical protein